MATKSADNTTASELAGEIAADLLKWARVPPEQGTTGVRKGWADVPKRSGMVPKERGRGEKYLDTHFRQRFAILIELLSGTPNAKRLDDKLAPTLWKEVEKFDGGVVNGVKRYDRSEDRFTMVLYKVADILRKMAADLVTGKTAERRGGDKTSRRLRQQHEKKLTAKQFEAMNMLAACNGNYAQAAKKLRIDRTALKDRIAAAHKKMGRLAMVKKPTLSMQGKKGHEMQVAGGERPDQQGDGKQSHRNYDRRKD